MHMRGEHAVGYAIGHSAAGQFQRLAHVFRAVINGRQQVAVKVDHGLENKPAGEFIQM
jgi:hypothetical protein